MHQTNIIMPKWWIQVMEYLRVAPGRIYPELLLEKLRYYYNLEYPRQELPAAAEEDVVSFMNHCTPSGVMGERNNHYLKTDVLTNGIYTVPSQRVTLDAAIKSASPDYIYNPYLYIDECPLPPEPDISTQDILADPRAYADAFIYDPNNRCLTMDLTKLPRKGENLVFQDFDLNDLVAAYMEMYSVKRLGAIHAPNTLFLGRTKLSIDDYSVPTACSYGLCMNGSTFFGDFEMRNLTFAFAPADQLPIADYEANKVDFRNVRFFGSVSVKDIRFVGDVLDTEMSMEDARIQHSIIFFNVEFGRTNLNCFQMVVGNFVDRIAHFQETPLDAPFVNSIRLSNVSADTESLFDFTDVEMQHGSILLQNITTLPDTKLCLSPVCCRSYDKNTNHISCPHNYLLIQNCEIQNTLYIGNVSELSFWGTHNYDRIVGASNWGRVITTNKHYRKKSRGMVGTMINNNLLLAVYNNQQIQCFLSSEACSLKKEVAEQKRNQLSYSKAYDFILLKENFHTIGLYDDEDVASVLYMEFKPFVDSTTRSYFMKPQDAPVRALIPNLLYRILYSSGKYGISPLRVVVSTGLMVLLFTLFYSIFAFAYGSDAFTLGNALNAFWMNTAQGHSPMAPLLASFLFSLECIIPFVSQFEPIHPWVCTAAIIQNAIGSFLVGYFSIAVVRKTLRS